MNFFLRLKHWQLFIIMYGVPAILGTTLMLSVAPLMDMDRLYKVLNIFPFMILYMIIAMFSWLYSLGTQLYKKLPEQINMNLMRFKIFLVIPVLYMMFLSIFMYHVITDYRPNLAWFALVVPMHLFSIFCILYNVYFIAKELKTIEWQRPVTFSDFAGEFFLFWFFPVGVWILQPRINKIFNEHASIDAAY